MGLRVVQEAEGGGGYGWVMVKTIATMLGRTDDFFDIIKTFIFINLHLTPCII